MNKGVRSAAWFFAALAAATIMACVIGRNNFIALLMALVMSAAIYMARKNRN